MGKYPEDNDRQEDSPRAKLSMKRIVGQGTRTNAVRLEYLSYIV